VLPSDEGSGLWLTARGLALVLDVELHVVRRRLLVLLDAGLVRDDWRRPPAFARTLAGDVAVLDDGNKCSTEAGGPGGRPVAGQGRRRPRRVSTRNARAARNPLGPSNSRFRATGDTPGFAV
jgi:hypothetical protein